MKIETIYLTIKKEIMKKIKFFNDKKGFGFTTRNEFFHISNWDGSQPPQKGQRVVALSQASPRGLTCYYITPFEDVDVKVGLDYIDIHGTGISVDDMFANFTPGEVAQFAKRQSELQSRKEEERKRKAEEEKEAERRFDRAYSFALKIKEKYNLRSISDVNLYIHNNEIPSSFYGSGRFGIYLPIGMLYSDVAKKIPAFIKLDWTQFPGVQKIEQSQLIAQKKVDIWENPPVQSFSERDEVVADITYSFDMPKDYVIVEEGFENSISVIKSDTGEIYKYIAPALYSMEQILAKVFNKTVDTADMQDMRTARDLQINFVDIEIDEELEYFFNQI